jgi:hypothetical protein
MTVGEVDALNNVSDMIEELWGGLVLAVEDDGLHNDAIKALLGGLLRIANLARSEVEIARGTATRA